MNRPRNAAALEDRLRTVSDSSERLRTLNELAACLASSDSAAALGYAREALTLARDEGQLAAEIGARLALSQVHWNRSELAEATDHASAAMVLAREAGDDASRAKAHLVLGSVLLRQSRLARAGTEIMSALRAAESSKDLTLQAVAHNSLGVLYSDYGSQEKALAHWERSAALNEQSGDRYRLSMAITNIGNQHFRAERNAEARACYERAIDILEEIEPEGYPIGAAYDNLGDVAYRDDDLAGARRYLTKAIKLRRTLSDTAGVASSSNALAFIENEIGDATRSRGLYSDALESAIASGALLEQVTATRGLFRAAEAAGDVTAALAHARDALELQQRLYDETGSQKARELEARYDLERAEQDEEIQHLRNVELMQEIGRRRDAERSLAELRRLESLGLLAGGVAHNFNNLLTVILGQVELVRYGDALTEPQRDGLDNALHAITSAASLSRKLLVFSRTQRQTLEPVNLSALLEDLVPDLHQRLRSEIILEIETDPEARPVLADRSHLRRVILSLVDNAVDAIAGVGSVSIEVLRGQRNGSDADVRAGDWTTLVVSDTGRGMDEETQSRAFDPFFTRKASGRSAGLGLAIVYGVVQQCGGNLTVQSWPGEGTRVFVALPEATEPESPPRTEPSAQPDASDRTVVVVDDDAGVRRLTGKILREAGYYVLEAADVPSAQSLFDREDLVIDALVTDVMLPENEGPAMAITFREQHPAIAVVFMSGYPESIARRPETMDDEFLAKPFTRDELLRAVSRSLARSQAQ